MADRNLNSLSNPLCKPCLPLLGRHIGSEHRDAGPFPAAKEMIAADAAPPAPTGAITLPIQLIRFNQVPSGCAPVWPWTATFVWGADTRFCAINPASVTTSRASGYFSFTAPRRNGAWEKPN